MTITDNADRDALLRYLDLQNDLSDLVNKYGDLGVMVVSTTLKSKAYETMACAHLPQRYQAPPAQVPTPMTEPYPDDH